MLALLVAGTAACGSSKSGPSAPSPTLTGVAITPAMSMMTLKGTQSFSAMATYSDGSVKSVQATWGSDTPGVAIVDANGVVSAIGPGQATIVADYQSRRATRLLRVMPSYAGTWEGKWSLTSCTAAGEAQDICDENPVGSLFGLRLVLDQSGETVTVREISLVEGATTTQSNVTATVEMGGHLVLGGEYTMIAEGEQIALSITSWQTITLDNQQMTGLIRVVGRAADGADSAQIDGVLQGVSKR